MQTQMETLNKEHMIHNSNNQAHTDIMCVHINFSIKWPTF